VDPDAFAKALEHPRPGTRPNIFGDGHAAHRIAQLVVELASGELEAAA
jgi:hypothetical protein